MALLRFRLGDALVGELDVGDQADVEIGNRPSDAVSLASLGLSPDPEVGGRLARKGDGWAFAPRTGGAAVPLADGERLAVGGGTLEVRSAPETEPLALSSVPLDAETPRPLASLGIPGGRSVALGLLAELLPALDLERTLDGALARALDAAVQGVEARRAMVALLEGAARGAGDPSLRVVASQGLDGPPAGALSRSVLDAVLVRGEEVFTGDAPADIGSESVRLSSVRSICALPLQSGGRVQGVLYVDRGTTRAPFGREDYAFLQVLAGLLSRRLASDERLLESEREREALARRVAGSDRGDVGWRSPPMARLHEQAVRLLPAFAKRTLPVLVTGESGTGKEVLAGLLHARLGADRGPFVAVNCAAIPHDLAESELFGIEQGVASGVLKRTGRLEQASGGTLFLDEIGETTPAVQAKLLRALESGRVQRVGGRQETPVAFRLVSATNTDLPSAIRAGRFREDLYWRIAGVTFHLPPLRERREDVPDLALLFAARVAAELGVPPPTFTERAMARLVAWSWPGNVRELKQRVGALTVLAAGGRIDEEALPEELRRVGEGAAPERLASLDEVEQAHVARVLEATGGDRARAAEILGIHKKTLGRKLARE
jgi:DNA-binding NtrC family response regulator